MQASDLTRGALTGFKVFDLAGWNALYAPRDMPAPVVALLSKGLARILALPETRERLLQLGLKVAGGTPADLALFEDQERAKWAPLIKASGVRGG